MIRSFCIILFLLNIQVTMAQVFSIGHTSLSFADSSRSRTIPAEVYYPADSAGDNVPLTAAAGTFPVIVFGHGFVMTWDAYQNIWEALVPEGFILVFPTTEGSLSPSHLDFGKDLAFCGDAMHVVSTNPSSIFFNRVDTATAVMGHSMGGGASFLAVQFNPRITAMANLSAAETNPSAIAAASGISIPALAFAGENDCVTPPPANQVPMYDSLHSACKAFIEIHGASHCQMAESNFFCNFGESTCTPAPTISRASQHAAISRYLVPWMKYQLKGDCTAGLLFDSLLAADTSVSFQKTCAACINTGMQEYSVPALEIYPNPVRDQCTVIIKNRETKNLGLFTTSGRMVRYYKVDTTREKLYIDLLELNNGVYILKNPDRIAAPPVRVVVMH